MRRRGAGADGIRVKAQPAPKARKRASLDDAMVLWRLYKDSGDMDVRNRLVLTYAPLVKYIVFKKVREMPARCEVEEFVGCGLEALITAIDRFDPEKGATLEQFLWTRVHGAVLDELRRQDWAPRSLRRWEREINKATDEFTVLHGRAPSRQELADCLAVTIEELHTHQDDIALCDTTSLNLLIHCDDTSTVERIDSIACDDLRRQPDRSAELQQAKERFRAAFDQLPQREREIAVLLYVKNLNLREIAGIYGLSESRISQIHTQIRKTLRARLSSETELFMALA
jgi:RNA polymerase sigma factor for flagellar operon FliA